MFCEHKCVVYWKWNYKNSINQMELNMWINIELFRFYWISTQIIYTISKKYQWCCWIFSEAKTMDQVFVHKAGAKMSQGKCLIVTQYYYTSIFHKETVTHAQTCQTQLSFPSPFPPISFRHSFCLIRTTFMYLWQARAGNTTIILPFISV